MMAGHGSADGGHGAGDGPPPQCTARGACGGGARLRARTPPCGGQKGPSPGTCSGVLTEPAAQLGIERASCPRSGPPVLTLNAVGGEDCEIRNELEAPLIVSSFFSTIEARWTTQVSRVHDHHDPPDTSAAPQPHKDETPT